MCGQEFNGYKMEYKMEFDGYKMDIYGNGIDEDWRTVLEMCSLEKVGLKAESC